MRTVVHGETHILAHCIFRWEEIAGARMYIVEPQHCETCLLELRRIAPHAQYAVAAKLAPTIRRP